MPAKKKKAANLTGKALVKEVNRLIRLARKHWDDHNNKACRRERERALQLYEKLSEQEKEQVPQVLRVWLRYRSEKYFGKGRQGNGAHSKK
ncbi:MAG: Precorrin-3B methylase [Verrucomicrobiota bacterium JB023]|nr:Precorrin-3B methylase [Verrucomicrobiota bacterium JB023]